MGHRRLWGGILSLIIPGAGHFAIGRPWRGVAWWCVAAASLLLMPFVVWMPLWFSMLLVRVVSAVEVAVLTDVRAVAWSRILGMWALCLVVTFAFTRVVRAYYLESYVIPAGSMIPTLQIGDHIFINKLADVGPGDVIVFTNPCDPNRDFVKRMVAEGGDTVETRCGKLYVNDKLVTGEPAGDCEYSDYDGLRWYDQTCTAYRETLDDRGYTIVLPRYVERYPHDRDFPGSQPPSCMLGDASVGRVEPSQSDNLTDCSPKRHYVIPEGYVFVLGDNRHNSSDSRYWGPVPVDNIKGKAFLIWWSSPEGRDINWGRINQKIE